LAGEVLKVVAALFRQRAVALTGKGVRTFEESLKHSRTSIKEKRESFDYSSRITYVVPRKQDNGHRQGNEHLRHITKCATEIDEFGFDRLERTESPQAANLLYKIIDARSRQRSTALVTNIDFDAWSEYLGDPPLAMAFLDRLVDGAIILKIKGKSYRAHRANRPSDLPPRA